MNKKYIRKVYFSFGISTMFILPLEANNLIEIKIPSEGWTLIGIPGAFMEGSNNKHIQTTGNWWSETNNSTFDKYVGLDGNSSQDEYNSSKHMVGFKTGLSDANVILSAELGKEKYDFDLPHRKMYASVPNSTSIDINITYQSDLEGNLFYVKTINTSGITQELYGRFNSAYGSANSFKLQYIDENTSDYSFNIRDIFDVNLSDNSGKDGQAGEITDFKDSNISKLNSSDTLKIFRLDGDLGGWESFFSTVSDSANDFTALAPGNGYWVYFKSSSSERNSSTKGFVLGDGWLNSDLYGNSTILSSSSNLGGKDTTYKTSRNGKHSIIEGNDGWRMVSFPDGYIRHSPTGLIMEINVSKLVSGSSGLYEYTIYDELERERVYIRLFSTNGNTDVNTTEFAVSTNMAIARAIEEGNVSRNFNVRAFASGDKNVTLLSDKRFKIADINSSSVTDDVIQKVVTLTGVQIANDLNTTIVSSQYGEYGLVATINNDGNGTVSGACSSSYFGKCQTSINDINFSIQLSNFTGLPSGIKATILDLDLNDKNDSVLFTSSSPFYIRDNSFIKVYRIDDNDTNSTVYFDKTGDGDYTSSNIELSWDCTDSNCTKFALGKINSAIGSDFDANTSTVKDQNYSIFIMTTNPTYRNFDIKEHGTGNIFSRVVSNDPLALGSITKVYSIDELAKADINKSRYTFEVNATHSDFNFTIDGIVLDQNNTDGNVCGNFKTLLNKSSAYAYIDCNSSSDDNNTVAIYGYFAGFELNTSTDSNISIESNSTGGVALQNVKTLSDDLRYIPIYTPDYTTSDGILYLIRENGYSVTSMLSAVNRGNSVSWRYIDLTVPADEWFSFDYNLYTTEIENGYFIKVEQETYTPITVTATFKPNYIQHYDNNESSSTYVTGGNVDNFFTGTLSATVSNSDSDFVTVSAKIGDREYQLIKNGKYYSLSFSSDDLQNLEQKDINITVTAYDEKGNSGSDEVIFDNKPPVKPVLEFFDGKTLFIGSASNDITEFNIYNGGISDKDGTSANSNSWVKYLTPENDYKTCVGSCDGYYGNKVDEFKILETITVTNNNINTGYYLNINLIPVYSLTLVTNWGFYYKDNIFTIEYLINILGQNINYSSYTYKINNKNEANETNISYISPNWWIEEKNTNIFDTNASNTTIYCTNGYWFSSADGNTSQVCSGVDLNVTFTSFSTSSISSNDRNATINYPADAIGTEINHNDNNTTLKFMLYNICADAPDFDTNNSDWRVVAVDGDPETTNFRASDITFIPDWFAIYKNASILEVNTTANTIDNKPYTYNNKCEFTKQLNSDNGVILTNDGNDSDHNYTIRIAYDTVSTSSVSSDIPVKVALSFEADGTDYNKSATIQFSKTYFASSYNGGHKKTILIDINNTKFYKLTFDDLVAQDTNAVVLTNYLFSNELNQTIHKKQ
jgi:hypothetical protein